MRGEMRARTAAMRRGADAIHGGVDGGFSVCHVDEVRHELRTPAGA